MTRFNSQLVLATTATLALGRDGSGPSERLAVAGPWSFSESLSDQAQSMSCSASGTLDIAQTGETFTGTFSKTGVCAGTTGSSDNSASGTIQDGRVSKTAISFRAAPCQYEGSTSGSPPNRMTGSASCTLQLGGGTVEVAGTWQAMR